MTDLTRRIVRAAASSGAPPAAAVLLSFASSGLIVVGLGLPSRLLVFAVIVALQTSRRSSRASHGWRVTLPALPILAVVTGLLGDVMLHHRAVGDVLVVVALAGSFAVRDAPEAIARLGPLLLLPVMMVFVTPVPTGSRGGHDLGWYLAFSIVAGGCAFAADRLLGEWASARAARLDLEDLPRLLRRRAPSARRQVAELDGLVDPDDTAFRSALLQAELAATADPAGLDAALDELAKSTVDARFERRPHGSGEPRRPSKLRPSASMRIAIHSGVALALSLVIAQWLFPARWSWAAVSVIAISSGLRSRGDVLIRGAERLGGALAGTIVATLVAPTVGESHALAIVLVLALVVAGSLLRQSAYALYAFCVTSALALLYALYGEQGSHLLGERLAENAIGAACVIVSASVLFPIRTDAVIRRRVADLLATLAELLASLGAGESGDIVDLSRAVGRRRDALVDALRPVTIHGHVSRLLGRAPQRAAGFAATAIASTDAARPIVYSALTGGADAAAVTALQRQVRGLRRDLASASGS